MPELPEVEIVRRGLAPLMEGAQITNVELRRPDLRFAFQHDFAARLERRTIKKVERRAKYIVITTDTGDALVVHLGMTGRFRIAPPALAQTSREAEALAPASFVYDAGLDPAHDHVVIRLADGTGLTYNDVRRFGYMLVLHEEEFGAHPLFRGLGAEPLSEMFDGAYLLERAAGKRLSLKAFLLDQRIIAGLGNIYVCEALFDARLSPFLAAQDLTAAPFGPAAADRLAASIKKILRRALEAGGSSFRDYRQADGSMGSYQERFLVYGRPDEPCRANCGTSITRLVQHGRSTFYCPTCQPCPQP